MSGLQDIPITVVHQVKAEVTANVQAILTEVSNLLGRLLDHNEINAIDLRSLPLLPGELEALKTILGEGEINVEFESLGKSRIYETALSGVWWIHHLNDTDDTIAELIEVTHIPDILKSQKSDIMAAHSALQEQLQDWT